MVVKDPLRACKEATAKALQAGSKRGLGRAKRMCLVVATQARMLSIRDDKNQVREGTRRGRVTVVTSGYGKEMSWPLS